MGVQRLSTFEKGGDIFLSSIVWSPNGKNIAVASIDGGVATWDVDGCRLDREYAYSGREYKGVVDLMTWSPDGKFVAYGMFPYSQPGYVIQVFRVAFCWPPTNISAFVSNRRDVDTNKPLTWTPDGRYVALGYKDGTIQTFDAFSGRTVSSTGTIQSVLFSPDRKYVISHINMNQVLEASSQKVISVFNGHQGRIMKSVWAPNGQYIASSGLDDYTIRIWRAFSGEELYMRSFSSPPFSGEELYMRSFSSPHLGLNHRVEGIAWSPNGRYIAFGADRTIYVMEMKSETSFVY